MLVHNSLRRVRGEVFPTLLLCCEDGQLGEVRFSLFGLVQNVSLLNGSVCFIKVYQMGFSPETCTTLLIHIPFAK